MDAIGGYFSLELPYREEFHQGAIRLNTGRNCLEYILRTRKYSKVYIPYYTCEVILEPFHKTATPYEFYHVNLNFELAETIVLEDNEALLYTNYFGLKQRYVESLTGLYGKQLIVDNTQAFYAKPIPGIDSFNTCRKFFGVPDGAYLYTDVLLDDYIEQDISYGRMNHLMKRIDLSPEEGYGDFRNSDDSLDGQPIKWMSKLTKRMMQSVDYDYVANRRRLNYSRLHKTLSNTNQLDFVLEDEAVPLAYPYMVSCEGLRSYLIDNRIFVAKYWPNVSVWTNSDMTENRWPDTILPLPIDQRYNDEDIDYIITKIQAFI